MPKARPVKKSTKTAQTPIKKTPKTSSPLKDAVPLASQSAPQEETKVPYASKGIRRLYRKTLNSMGTPNPVWVSKPDGMMRMNLCPLATEEETDDVAKLKEQKALIVSKSGARAIEPRQDACGARIDLHLLWIVVEKLGGFEKVEDDDL